MLLQTMRILNVIFWGKFFSKILIKQVSHPTKITSLQISFKGHHNVYFGHRSLWHDELRRLDFYFFVPLWCQSKWRWKFSVFFRQNTIILGSVNPFWSWKRNFLRIWWKHNENNYLVKNITKYGHWSRSIWLECDIIFIFNGPLCFFTIEWNNHLKSHFYNQRFLFYCFTFVVSIVLFSNLLLNEVQVKYEVHFFKIIT